VLCAYDGLLFIALWEQGGNVVLERSPLLRLVICTHVAFSGFKDFHMTRPLLYDQHRWALFRALPVKKL
jgi:hypothetical protein